MVNFQFANAESLWQFVFDDSEFYVWKKTQPQLLFLSFSGAFGEESGNWRREEEEEKIGKVFILFLFLFNCGFYSQYYHAFIYV